MWVLHFHSACAAARRDAMCRSPEVRAPPVWSWRIVTTVVRIGRMVRALGRAVNLITCSRWFAKVEDVFDARRALLTWDRKYESGLFVLYALHLSGTP